MPEDRKTIPPKIVSECWNLMSFYEKRVSARCYNNPLENRLMRWFIWVMLRVAYTFATCVYIGCPHTGTSSREQAALCTHVHVSMRWMDVWQPCRHRSMSPFCPVVVWNKRYVCHSVTVLVRETAEDDQERTNDGLRTSCCVTFGHAHTMGMVAGRPDVCDVRQLLYRWKVDV